MNTVQERIEGLLIETERDGILDLIDMMRKSGFFTQPCSGAFHLAKEGGLAEHSLNVFCLMEKLRDVLYPEEIAWESVAVCALLHDLGKCGQFGKPGYIPNMLKGRATKANPNPEPVQSEKKPYLTNPDLLYIDHEIRSIQMASQYIELTEDENWAILNVWAVPVCDSGKGDPAVSASSYGGYVGIPRNRKTGRRQGRWRRKRLNSARCRQERLTAGLPR